MEYLSDTPTGLSKKMFPPFIEYDFKWYHIFDLVYSEIHKNWRVPSEFKLLHLHYCIAYFRLWLSRTLTITLSLSSVNGKDSNSS